MDNQMQTELNRLRMMIDDAESKLQLGMISQEEEQAILAMVDRELLKLETKEPEEPKEKKKWWAF